MGDRVKGGIGPQTADTAIMANISCVTFNHAGYVRIALDGFPMQKTSFASEILVHGDASIDGTNSVIREYAARYPDQVKPLVQTGNQYSQEIDNINGASNSPRTRGKYILMCDGDDYLLSPNRLQRQVNYMEVHPDCTLCIHSTKIDLVGRALTEGQMRSYRESRVLSLEEIINKSSGYAMSSMALPTRLVKELSDYYVDCPVGDMPIQLIATANGYGYYFDDAMSAYQVGVAGSQTVGGKNEDYQGKQRACCNCTKRTYEQSDRATGGRLKETAEGATRRTYHQTMVSTKQFEEISNPQYRRYYKELASRVRFFLRSEHTMPAVYEIARKTFIGK